MGVLHSLVKNPFPLSHASFLRQKIARDDDFISAFSATHSLVVKIG